MSHRRFPSSLFPVFIIFLVLHVMISIPQSLGHHDIYEECRVAQFVCENISVGYPFSGDGIPERCGYPGLQLDCENNTTIIRISEVRYHVLDIDPDRQTLRIARQDLVKNDSCNPQFQSWNFDNELFDLVNASPGYDNITLFYGCSNFTQRSIGHFNCIVSGAAYKDVSVVSGVVHSSPCPTRVTVPIVRSSLAGKGTLNYSILIGGLKEGFEVKWKKYRQVCDKCEETGGLCGHDDFSNQIICYCPNPNDERNEITGCSSLTPGPAPEPNGTEHRGSKWKLNLIIGLTVAVTIVTVVVCTICFISLMFNRKCLSNRNSSHLQQQKMNSNASVEELITKFGSLAPKRYSYIDIKKMTKKFRGKLGEGGYGSVYKGKLPDGRLVAVKVLNESNGNGEEFINEVASISRTSHVNIVTLLGFCFDRSKRALVYELMPLGSLDKFIYHHGSRDQSCQLEWRTLYEIALGIARGLEYLHQGCNTRILHFDIKPHNILLDENFIPKISDFGLSKLCERKQSVISMTGARGTAGYIAPEVFCRNFGGVSHKSDVYSYGMMILEMIGGRKKIDVEVPESSEISFPSWIYKHIDHALNLSLHGITTDEEEEITRRLIVVSLWCIQTNPSDRPSMTKVLEMLQGSLQSLVIPPCPF